MIKNYFKTAYRSLVHNKAYSTINILGLAIGISAFLMISLFVYHEKSMDRFNEKADRVFRVTENLKTETEVLYQSTSSPAMGPFMQKDFPEVEDYVRMQGRGYLVQNDDKTFFERECLMADPSIFRIFSFKLSKGDPNTVLNDPFSVVVTEAMAKKYFGNEDPVGKSLELNRETYHVTGVAEEVPETSHFRFDMLVSFSTFTSKNEGREMTQWFNNSYHTYLLLSDKEAVENVRAKMPEFMKTHILEQGNYYKMMYEDLPLQPLTSIYLTTPRSWENGKRGSESNIYILSIVAVFILLIACFNYINLATARASRRLKEVGLRKVLGAQRSALISQFLGESMIVCSLSMIIGVGATLLLLPKFNTLVERTVLFEIVQPGFIWGALLAITVVLGLLSGTYPALVVSGFQPLQIFKQASGSRFGSQWLRTLLVSGQFVISIMLIAGTMLVYKQLSFMKNVNLGFNKEKMLVVSYRGGGSLNDHMETIKDELKSISGISSVTASGAIPGEQTSNQGCAIETENGKMSATNINTVAYDYDFIPTYGIKMVSGRAFSHDFPADDTAAFIINVAAARSLGLTPEDAVGKNVRRQGKDGKVVGVVEDFHYRSLHMNVEPLLIIINKNWCSKLTLKVQSDDLQATIAEVEKKWKALAPELPFTYSFLDDSFNSLYKTEDQLGKIVSIFSGLAIFVACMGLIGLTSFSVERRFKEIGIRKVLGSSVSGVVLLISKEFMRLVILSFILAVPLTYYLTGLWLNNFTTKISIDVLTFVIAGLSVILTAGLVISILCMKAATTNPVDSLRVD